MQSFHQTQFGHRSQNVLREIQSQPVVRQSLVSPTRLDNLHAQENTPTKCHKGETQKKSKKRQTSLIGESLVKLKQTKRDDTQNFSKIPSSLEGCSSMIQDVNSVVFSFTHKCENGCTKKDLHCRECSIQSEKLKTRQERKAVEYISNRGALLLPIGHLVRKKIIRCVVSRSTVIPVLLSCLFRKSVTKVYRRRQIQTVTKWFP